MSEMGRDLDTKLFTFGILLPAVHSPVNFHPYEYRNERHFFFLNTTEIVKLVSAREIF